MKKWKPKKGELYWYATLEHGITQREFKNDFGDKLLLGWGNYWKTGVDAAKAGIKIKDCWKELRNELYGEKEV